MLSDFTVPGTNEYASMVDGAKRDRAIWSGDMNVEIPSVSYSTDNAAYIKGALAAARQLPADQRVRDR